ncbi:MAG: YcnI family protein [Nonomuraea sp.]|nr:YcnI family protein [Nonomuraea sp.]
MSVIRRGVTVLAAATAVTFGLALPALAHVTINPGTAEQGGFTKVAFRVPNERDDASTVKVEVAFPLDKPLLFVSVKPIPGWKAEVVDGKLPKPVKTEDGEVSDAVTKVVWSGGKISKGEFQEFEVSMGKLPTDASELAFPTTQTYSGGEVVKWADPPKTDGTEAEHPVPTLKLVAASGADAHGKASTAPVADGPTVKPVAAASTSDGTARVIGGAGVVVGAIGVVIGLLGLRRRPS